MLTGNIHQTSSLPVLFSVVSPSRDNSFCRAVAVAVRLWIFFRECGTGGHLAAEASIFSPAVAARTSSSFGQRRQWWMMGKGCGWFVGRYPSHLRLSTQRNILLPFALQHHSGRVLVLSNCLEQNH
jgi:hypothetical protein